MGDSIKVKDFIGVMGCTMLWPNQMDIDRNKVGELKGRESMSLSSLALKQSLSGVPNLIGCNTMENVWMFGVGW